MNWEHISSLKLYYYFIPLIITLFLEIVMSILLGVRRKENIKKIIFINVITNVLLNIINIHTNFKISVFLSAYFGINIYTAKNSQIFILELIVLIIETIYYCKYMIYEENFILNVINNKLFKYFIYSLLLNLVSYFGGKIIHICLNI